MTEYLPQPTERTPPDIWVLWADEYQWFAEFSNGGLMFTTLPRVAEQWCKQKYPCYRPVKFVPDAIESPWKAYAIALQQLHDSGGAIMEPALAREVEELREKCE